MRLIIKDYLLQLKEKDELDLLLCDVLFQMGYITDNRPKTGNRQFGVDIRAHNDDTLILCSVKQGDVSRRIWDSDQNSVRQSLNEIHDCYLRLLTEDERLKKLRVIVATNGMLDEAVVQNWNGYVEDNTLWKGTPVNIEFWNIDTITDLIQTYLFDERIFDAGTQSLLRRALYYIGEGDYPAKYYEEIIDGSLQGLSVSQSLPERKKRLSTVFLAAQMVAQYAAEARIYKIAVSVSEYLIIKYWNFLLTNTLFGKETYVEWLLKFISVYEKWNFSYYNAIKYVCEGANRFPAYNSVEQRIVLYDLLGRLSTYAYYLSFKNSMESQKLANEILNSIVMLINNYPQTYYPPYDVHIGVISMICRLVSRLRNQSEAELLIKNYCQRISLYFQLYKKYPSPLDSFKHAVDIYLDSSEEEYETSSFWGVMLEWIALIDNENIYEDLQTFFSKDLKKVTKCAWFLRADEETYLYGLNAMYNAGDGVAIKLCEDYKSFKDNITYIMNQYTDEKFSFDEYAFPALEFILARYFNHLVRVKKEQ